MNCQNYKSTFYYTVRLVTRTIISIFYSLKVKGTENVLRGGNSYIIASNHINWFDGFVLIALFKDKITFLAASYLFERPIVGGFLTRMGSISVSQIKTRKAIKEALNILKNGGIIGIFPEGGVRLTKEMHEIKRGAFFLAHTANVPIIPVGIQGTNHVFFSRRKPFHRCKIVVNIGKPIYPEETDRGTTEIVAAKITELS
ncbi:MAG: lysophospholipid acyltransferase family protein [candidate division WOR-3 bacterium]|nr:lysophospholipid acyltransferase family protein [candidate division WOR-3 bacterium]